MELAKNSIVKILITPESMQHFCEIYLFIIGHCNGIECKSSFMFDYKTNTNAKKKTHTHKTHPINECENLQSYSKLLNTR